MQGEKAVNIDHNFFMEKALQLALKARPSPNPRVGAVIVRNNRIIGQGWHKKAGLSHAEINAINDAKRKGQTDFSKCILYVTLEPCSFHGRTPACTDAIIKKGFTHVVVGAKDPNPKVSGKGFAQLRKQGIDVKQGILAQKASDMNEGYNHYITTGKPLVIVKAALTADGKMAAKDARQKWISNKASRKLVHEMRTKYDAILVGIGTIMKDNPRLTSRIKQGIDPLRIIMDSKLSLSMKSNVLADRNVIIFTSSGCDKKKKKILERRGYEIIVNEKNKVDLKKAISMLGNRGITSIMVEGGAKIISSILRKHLAEKIVLFIAPKIKGGKNAPSFLVHGIEGMQKELQLKNIIRAKLGNDTMLKADIDKASR